MLKRECLCGGCGKSLENFTLIRMKVRSIKEYRAKDKSKEVVLAMIVRCPMCRTRNTLEIVKDAE